MFECNGRNWVIAASAVALLSGGAASASAQQAAGQQAPPAGSAAAASAQDEGLQVTNVGGRWELNWQQSDKPPESLNGPGGGERGEGPRGGRRGGGGGMGGMGGGGMRGGMGGRGGMGRGEGMGEQRGQGAREEMRAFMQAPRTMVIVEHPDHVSITDENGEVIKLTPNGVKVKEEQAGRSFERQAHWDGRTLVSEAVLGDGTKVTQTFQKAAEGLQLIVTTKVENSRFGRPIELKRVYDQALQQ